MKSNRIVLTLILVAWTTIISAQITRIQADTIVKKHLQSESVGDSLLYVNVNLPNATGIVITTSNNEIVKATYACWVYYLNESNLSQCRYLFVKEDNGNLLEVIANNDSGQNDTTQWEKVVEDTLPLSLVERTENIILPLYPNPTNSQLRITNYDFFEIESIEIYDVVGRLQYIHRHCGLDPQSPANNLFNEIAGQARNDNKEIVIDISHLANGIYFLKIKTNKRIIVQKIVKY